MENYLKLLVILVVFFFFAGSIYSIHLATTRFNKLYRFFIKNRKNYKLLRTDIPDPNDDSGCPTEEELTDEF